MNVKVNKAVRLNSYVRESLEQQLARPEFGLDTRRSRVILRKGYRTEDRDARVVFDLGFEAFGQGETQPYVRWVWRIRNFNRPVTLADVHAIDDKLSQVWNKEVKGTIATISVFEPDVVEYARVRGIGLARFLRQGQLLRLTPEPAHLTPDLLEEGLTHEEPQHVSSMMYALQTNGEGTTGFNMLVAAEIARPEEQGLGATCDGSP